MGAGIFDYHLRPTNLYSTALYQHGLEIRQRCLSGTQHGNDDNDNGAVPYSETRNPEYGDSRGRAPDGTTCSTPADPAPEVSDEAVFC
jgi:hypothetical protein